MLRPPAVPAAGGLCAALLLGGCSAGAGDVAQARAAAAEFHRLLSAGDPAGACRLLTPRAEEDVRGPDDDQCPSALAALPIPEASRPVATSAWGRSAMVTFAADTVFVARFADGWRVTAAGCTQRADQPFDCAFQGG